MTTETKTIVALYGRVSTEQQVLHGDSLADQRDTLLKWAQSMGWEVADLYIDQGITGGISERPELQRLMKDASAGRFNLVAVLKLDRFYREQRLLANCIHEFDELHIGFISQSESIDTRIPGMTRVYLAMMGSMAQYERECISERQTRARAYHKSLGQWTSGRTLFGYRYNKTTKTLEIVESEAEVVRFIFTKYTTEKIGLAKLAIELNKTTLPPPRVRKHQQRDFWTQGGILHTLKHPAYKGGPSDDWPYQTPAIVAAEMWQAAAIRRNDNFHFRPSDQHKTKYQGRLICGLCGRRLSIGYNGGHRKIYSCPGRAHLAHPDGSPKCILPRFETDVLDEKINYEIQKLTDDPTLLANYFENYAANLKSEQQSLTEQLKPLKGEADAIREELTICDARLEMKRISPEVYKTRVKELQSKLHNIEKRTNQLDPTLMEQMQIKEQTIQMYEHFVAVMREWEKKDWDTIKKKSYDERRHPLDVLIYQFSHPAVKHIWKLPQPDNAIEELGGIFKYFIIYPDKVELKGNINIANLKNGTATKMVRLTLRRSG